MTSRGHNTSGDSPDRFRTRRSRSRSQERVSHRRKRSRTRSRSPRHHSSDHAHRHRSTRYSSPDDRRQPVRDRSIHKERDERGFGYSRPQPGREHTERGTAEPLQEAPAAGDIVQGRVHTIKPFGVFVQMQGFRRHCLVHHTQVSDDIQLSKGDEDDMKVRALEFAAPQGGPVWVKITEISTDASGGLRVHGSMRAASQEDGRDLDPTGQLSKQAAGAGGGGGGGQWSDEPPTEGSLHRGTVKRVEPYGVFVQLEGYRRYGLVHSSQVSSWLEFSKEDSDEEKVAALQGVVNVGDSVWVKVVEIQPDDGSGRGPKVGCSMKLVSQTDGSDLDPSGSRYQPRDAGGGEGGRRGAPIGSKAGQVASGGRVEWGHLKAGDKVYGGGKYDLIDIDTEEQRHMQNGNRGPIPGPASNPPPPPMGRGRDMVQPAWMTEGDGHAGIRAPGSSGEGLPLPPPPPLITSVEQAMAILQQLKSKKKKRHKEKDKKSKHKKHKEKSGSKEKRKKEKSKKEKRHRSDGDKQQQGGGRRGRSESSSSGHDSSSSDS